MNQLKNYAFFFALMSMPSAAHAYIGPALSGSTIAVILGLLASIAFAVFTVIWYPVKHMRRKRKQQGLPPVEDTPQPGETD